MSEYISDSQMERPNFCLISEVETVCGAHLQLKSRLNETEKFIKSTKNRKIKGFCCYCVIVGSFRHFCVLVVASARTNKRIIRVKDLEKVFTQSAMMLPPKKIPKI